MSYPSGEARRITSDLTSYLGLSLAPDGHSLVCIRNERRSTIWTQPEGDATKAAAVSIDAGADDGIHGMAWAPDGRIVFTTESNGNPDIWIMNSDGSRRIQLTSTPGQDISPRVTADGKYIVFVSDRDGGLRLWRMGLDGSGAFRLSEDLVARGRGDAVGGRQVGLLQRSLGTVAQGVDRRRCVGERVHGERSRIAAGFPRADAEP